MCGRIFIVKLDAESEGFEILGNIFYQSRRPESSAALL
jgi:hypothetical protein